MISIIISEKGGAERRERYEVDEITIGRVKGNDLLLARGNVSKRHARLIFRDGRYIVTDLKSTNGTYVNHRRITSATLVREGDRIYVGDFVLRIEDPQKPDPAVPAAPASTPSGVVEPESSTGSSSRRERASGGVAATPSPHLDAHDVVSHFPIEHDPDDSSPAIEVPGPPKLPTGVRPSSGGPQRTPTAGTLTDTALSTLNSEAAALPSSALAISSPAAGSVEPVTSDTGPGPVPTPADLGAEKQRIAAQQALLDTLVSATEEQIGGAALDAAVHPSAELRARIEGVLDARLGEMTARGPLAGGIEASALREAARRELCDLGPLGPLLADENVTRVQVLLCELGVHRRGRKVAYEGLAYTSERAVGRAVRRLCADAGVGSAAEGEPRRIDVELGNGKRLFAVRPPVSPRGQLVVVERERRPSVSLEQLVRNGTISRGMATLLGHCVAARANILVAGAVGTGAPGVLDALVRAVPHERHSVWLVAEGHEDAVPSDGAALLMGGSAEAGVAAVQAAARLAPDHVVVPPVGGAVRAALLDAVGQGLEGVLMCAQAAGLGQALGRMAAELSAARAGLTPEIAWEWLGASFDLGVEVGLLRDGRMRVLRLAELRTSSQGTRVKDIFTFAYHRTAAGGAIEGSFYCTGHVPRIVDHLSAIGMPLDTSIFRRHPYSA
jgi:pilus assembly protein CpaF